MAQWLPGRVAARVDWTENLCSLQVEAAIAPFRAGQFVKIGLGSGDDAVGRPYSLVNAPHEPLLEFYFSIVPEGPLSPRLARLNAGAPVLVMSEASGFLVLDEVPPASHLWLISSGTGIGPFLSMLKTAEPWQRFQRVVLVHAVRHAEELSYRHTIAAVADEQRQKFCYVPFVSREQVDFALAGRIPEALKDQRLEERAGIAIERSHSHVMLCGNPAMVADVTAALKARGLTKHKRREPGQISAETYW